MSYAAVCRLARKLPWATAAKSFVFSIAKYRYLVTHLLKKEMGPYFAEKKG
jgi:hypothetical protein